MLADRAVMPATSSLPLTFKPSERTKTPTRFGAASARPIAAPQSRECSGDGAGSLRHAQVGRVETNCGGGNLFVGHVLIANLPASAAAEDMRGRETSRAIPHSARRKPAPASAEEENQDPQFGALAGSNGPAGGLAPRHLRYAHQITCPEIDKWFLLFVIGF